MKKCLFQFVILIIQIIILIYIVSIFTISNRRYEGFKGTKIIPPDSINEIRYVESCEDCKNILKKWNKIKNKYPYLKYSEINMGDSYRGYYPVGEIHPEIVKKYNNGDVKVLHDLSYKSLLEFIKGK